MGRTRIATWLEEVRGRLVAALPVIVFFIALFWIVKLGFGDDYLLVLAPYTSLFEARLGKYNPPGQYARFFLASSFSLLAARIAVTNLPLCVITNLLVPFVLVFMRSSQLNPRRYFPYTMLFAYLELRPENLVETFAAEAAILLTCCSVLSAALLAAGLARRHDRRARRALHESVARLADDLDRIAGGGVGPVLGSELLEVRRSLSELAYSAREDSSAPARVANLLDMIATLAQRTAYLAGNLDWAAADGGARTEHARRLGELANLTRRLNDAFPGGEDEGATATTATYQELLAKVRTLLDEPPVPEDRFRIFYRSYLNMVALILRTAADPRQRVWRMSAANQARATLFRKRPTLDSFEMRFSVRCGVVLAASCAINMLFPVDHLYWFVLHAFLLLQPFPDESRHRMCTRMLGTVIGCLFVHAVALLDLGWAGITVLGMALVAPLYVARPGTVSSAFFATAYACSMASISIDDAYATSMRLFCLVLAIVCVALVDRLVLPTSDRRLFVANLRQMCDMLGRSWELAHATLVGRVDTVVSSERLLHFQMVHARATAFVDNLAKPGEKNREIAEIARYRNAAERALFCLWEAMSELEQLELLVRLREVGPDERATFERIIDVAERNCRPERIGTGAEAIEALLFGLSEPDLRYVLGQYADRVGELRLALDDARGALVERPSYADEIRGQS